MSELRPSYPPRPPFAVERLDVGDGHVLHLEQSGRPDGVPVVFLHGGPGGGLLPDDSRFFDPDRYRVVLHDQRGAGRSTPAGGLEHNTTAHLVADVERVREHLGIERWLVFGGSWGATLGIAYAQAHPDRVSALVLRGVYLVRPQELAWFYGGGLAVLRPQEWERFTAIVPAGERHDVLGAYHRRLVGADVEQARRWARPWMRWEGVNSTLVPDLGAVEEFAASPGALAVARVLAHYVVQGGFLPGAGLLAGVPGIGHLPAVVVQGDYDLCCPPATAWELVRHWPAARLELVPGAGHSAREPATTDRLVRATDEFARVLG